MTVGERIKQRRIELGLTQSDLAKRMGYASRAAICTVEKNKEDLTTARIRKYAEALQTTPAYLMGWDEAPSNDSDVTSPNPELVTQAMDLYELYVQAPPKIRAAVEALLKSE